jgi:catechol 2,3-dioxygenase-like lactoylglutathione lyase family enzyme
MCKFWFDHLHLVVPDPEKSAEFYVKAFGAEKTGTQKTPDGRTRVDLNIVGGRMIINSPVATDKRVPDAPKKRYGFEHWGMKTDNLEGAIKACTGAGAELIQKVTVARPGVRIAFIMAPDNVLIEIVEMKEGAK